MNKKERIKQLEEMAKNYKELGEGELLRVYMELASLRRSERK